MDLILLPFIKNYQNKYIFFLDILFFSNYNKILNKLFFIRTEFKNKEIHYYSHKYTPKYYNSYLIYFIKLIKITYKNI